MQLFEYTEYGLIVEIGVNYQLHVSLVGLRRYLVLHDRENGVVISLYFYSPEVFGLIVRICVITKERSFQVND